MATYRTIRMSFWSDLYVETLSASEKLLYLYLFTCPHTNNLGVLAVSTRRMAYDTGLTQEAVHAALSLFERDRKIVMDGDTVWLCNFIRHQCSTSPKILASLRALLPAVESADIRKAIVERYPRRALPIGYRYRPGNRKGKRKGKIGSGRTDFSCLWRCWKDCSATSRTWTCRPK